KDGADGKDGVACIDGKDGADGKDADVWTPGPDGYWYKNGVKTENSWKASTLTAVVDGKKVRFTNIDGLEGDIVISMVLELKSLVFEPDFYWKGIEAFEVTNFLYKPITLVKSPNFAQGIWGNADEDYSADKIDAAKYAKEEVLSMAPDMQCTYHLNPANAEVKADKNAWKFIAYNKATRATTAPTFNIISADLKTKGKVTIHSQYKGDEIKDQETDKQVTVLALQYIAGDSVITSDYAAVQASKYQNLTLNNPKLQAEKKNHPKSHLYTTAGDAINAANPATVQIAWNNDKGIDLRQYVNTHYDRVNGDLDTKWDDNAASGTVEKSGFKYKFALVGYTAGINKTSQSAHAAIAADGYTLRAQMPKDGKQQAYAYNQESPNAEQNLATVGREPLVRVLLIDTIHNNIAAVGYIKIQITPTDPDPSAADVTMSESEVPYKIACENKEIDLKVISWYEIEEKILALVNMSKETFEATYQLDEFADGEVCQFAEIDGEQLEDNEEIGTITLKKDEGGNKTDVLRWYITNQKAYTLFKGSNETKTLVTYIRFKRKPDASAAKEYIWVKFTWTPKSVNVLPETTFSNEDKIKMFWYDTNSNVAGSGYADIHGNVEVVSKTTADKYVFNICTTLKENELTTRGKNADYDDVKATAERTFEFVSGTAGDNKLTASDDGKYLVYNKTNIAELNPETGEIEFLGYKDDK
ncbi:MAG: hypothetical protein K2J86_09590, partial [Prevotella sp.]|nr:hypothetical protein [Prevotella sp.]